MPQSHEAFSGKREILSAFTVRSPRNRIELYRTLHTTSRPASDRECFYIFLNMFENFVRFTRGPTQSTVMPVPTRHRRHACIKMRTALPANTKTRPNVVSMLVQRRWRWANIETALGQMLAFAGLHSGVCLHPRLRRHNILASRSGYF